MDLPQLTEDQPSHRPLVAAHAMPWPGEMAVFRSPSTDGFELLTTFGSRARIGALASDFYPGPILTAAKLPAVVRGESHRPHLHRIHPASRPTLCWSRVTDARSAAAFSTLRSRSASSAWRTRSDSARRTASGSGTSPVIGRGGPARGPCGSSLS